jgi:hypothetical protein
LFLFGFLPVLVWLLSGLWLRFVPECCFEFVSRLCLTQTWSQSDDGSGSLLLKARIQGQKTKPRKGAIKRKKPVSSRWICEKNPAPFGSLVKKRHPWH